MFQDLIVCVLPSYIIFFMEYWNDFLLSTDLGVILNHIKTLYIYVRGLFSFSNMLGLKLLLTQ